MKQRAFLSILLILVSLYASGEGPASPIDAVRLAWFYKPPKDKNLTPLAKFFQVFVLTKADEQVRDQLKSLGVQAPIMQYLRFDAIEDPGSCSARPHRNQVADR